jgi:hypothetical protein
METDDKDRQREMEEIEEIRKRLGDRAIEPEEELMVWRSIFFNIYKFSRRLLCLSVIRVTKKNQIFLYENLWS